MEHLTWWYIGGGVLTAVLAYRYYTRPRGECPYRTARVEKMIPKYKDL